MDEAVIKQIQREGADALLDIGVSVPLKRFISLSGNPRWSCA